MKRADEDRLPLGPSPQPPILKWAGGKTNLAKYILPIINKLKFETYIEPFAGSAAIFFKLAPQRAILGDSNRHLMRLYLTIKTQPEELSRELRRIESIVADFRDTPFISFYYHMREQFPKRDRVQNSALFLFLNRHCWNGLYRENLEGRFNVPIGSYTSPRSLPPIEQLVSTSELLRNASLQVNDFQVVSEFATSKDVVYLDPPYLPLSTTARFTNYGANDFSWQDQVRLKRELYRLDSRGTRFVLSNSYSKGLILFYKDFNHKVIPSPRSINSIGTRRTGFEELLISNFDI